MSLTSQIALRGLSELGQSLAAIIIGVGLLEGLVWLVAGKLFKSKRTLVWLLLSPAICGLILLVIYPILYEVRLSFSNMSLRSFRNPEFGLRHALENFGRVFTRPVLKQSLFYPIFLRTLLWTTIQVTSHVTVGMGLALLLNCKIGLKNVYKALLILPWAIPDIISGLVWRTEYNYEYGFINILLRRIGLSAIEWKAAPFWNFAAMNITNTWLGVPFMMVICLGGLQSISKEYYEAADMDGASNITKFGSITLPLMKPILTPAIILGIIWTFNNFNVPYFINQFELESSDILVTALFRAAFEYNQYGFAAAFAIVIFLILLGISLIYIKATGGLKGIRE